MNYIITEKQLIVLTENINSKKFSSEITGLIKEQNISLPYKFKGSHRVPNSEKDKCDALHGFQLARIGSDMNGEVKNELNKFSNQGVWVSDVSVTVDPVKLKVDWEVTIDKSDDGQFWNGFTSRGAGCNNNIENRWNAEGIHKNGPKSIKTNIESDIDGNGNKKIPVCKKLKDIQLVKKFESIYTDEFSGTSFIQGFYRYICEKEIKNNIPPKVQAQTDPNNTLKDYEGNYTFVSENGEKTTGNIKEENGKLRVSRGNDYFYLTKTQGEQFEGETKASNEQDKRIPKILGYITIEITAIFNRNSNKQVCSVDGTAKWGIKKEKIIATKDGISCADTSIQKPITTTSVSTQKPVDTPAQKSITTTSVPTQKTETLPSASTTNKQTNKTSTTQKPIKFLDAVSPNKYTVRKESVKNSKVISEDIENTNQKKPPRIYDAILVGGLDYRTEEVKTKDGKIKKVLIDKTIDEQLAIFQQGFGGGKVKAFRYNVPFETIMTYLKSSPKIPIFLFSAGCNFADELITSELVDKNKIYIIEPFNKGDLLNKSVSNAISKGLSPRNIFVKKGKPSRGYGFSGASDSGASSHWDALRTVPEKVKF